MSQEIEIEFKNLITLDEFEYLLSIYPFPIVGQTHVNHYFETNKLDLQQKRCTLRIREKNSIYQLTLKEPHTDGILETHDTMTKKEALNWLSGNMIYKPHVSKQLERLAISPATLNYIGELRTTRYEIKIQGNLIVLDHSLYHGVSDYELEIETQSKKSGHNFFLDFLLENNIQNRKTPNKIERFFNSLPK